MVFASAGTVASARKIAANAMLDIIMGCFQRKIWNIGLSPGVNPVKGRSFVMHAARYLGAVTRCNSTIFETCTGRLARQSQFSEAPSALPFAHVSLYKFVADHSRKQV